MIPIESKEQLQDCHQQTRCGGLRRLFGDPLLWLGFGLAVAAILAIYHHVHYVNGPTGPKQWQWPYRHRDIFLQSLLGAMWRLPLGGVLIGGSAWLIRRRMHPGTMRRWIGLVALFCWGAFFIWTNLIVATPLRLSHLPKVIKSLAFTSYFNVAQWIQSGRRPPLAETLQRYAELLPEFPMHASTHPPGAVLSGYGLLRLFNDHPALSASIADLYQKMGADPELAGVEKFSGTEVAALTLAILIILGGLLSVFPFFWLVRWAMREASEHGEECDAERTAWVAAVLWIHYPALALMLPAFDLLHPVITLLCIIVTMKGLRDRPAVWGIALGLLFMAGIILTFTLLLLVPMLCLLAWLELSRRAGSLRPMAVLLQISPRNPGGKRFWVLASATVITCLAVDVILRHVPNIHLMQIFFAAIYHQNHKLLAELNRTYQVWVFYNIWDLLLFAGLPLAVLALAWFGRALRQWWQAPAAIMPSIAIFPLTILIVDLSHQLSAETARVWLFLAPGIAWAGAAELVRRSGEHWRWVLAGLLLMQTLFIYVCRTNMQLWGF